jgi:NAD(P)-dependent dehydrogenase (short-subunit alcohol dehydrogenase family)
MAPASSRLELQRVLITGAASGIGRTIAEAFHSLGARVEICDIDEAALAACQSQVPTIGTSLVDLSDVAATGNWVDLAVDRLGGVDVLINNAGIKGPTAFAEDISHDDWRTCIAVTLDAQFVCAQRVIPHLKAQSSGSIINISSTAGLYGFGMRTPYAAAKWAVVGLTKSLAIELGPYGVRCNCVCPGSAAVQRIDRVINADAESRGSTYDAVAGEYVGGQSIKRFVEPSEVADLCVFLASPAAKMISGQAIAVDGHTEAFHI